MFVPPILLTVPIYRPNRSTCLRTVRFYSLLFTYDFFTRLAIFFLSIQHIVFFGQRILCFFFISRATVALFSRTSISFTSQLGPNNPNKWTNWEITSNWTEQWKLISHSKWAWQLQLQLQSSPSCIWASCLLDQCACNAFFSFFFASFHCNSIIQFIFDTLCACVCVLVWCCLHFEFTVTNVKIMNDIFNTKFSTGQLACEKWQCLNRIFHVVPMGLCDLLLWQHVSYAAVYSPFDNECWNYAKIKLLFINDICFPKKNPNTFADRNCFFYVHKLAKNHHKIHFLTIFSNKMCSCFIQLFFTDYKCGRGERKKKCYVGISNGFLFAFSWHKQNIINVWSI